MGSTFRLISGRSLKSNEKTKKLCTHPQMMPKKSKARLPKLSHSYQDIVLPFSPTYIERKHKQKANPNALYITYSSVLDQSKDVPAGNPIRCQKCPAMLSRDGAIVQSTGWICKFCGNMNAQSAPVEKIVEECVKYELKGGEEIKAETVPAFLFLIDISGSMSPGDLPGLNGVPPINILTITISEKLKELAKTYPKSKVGIILFNDKVQIIGDALGARVVIDKKEELENEASLRTYAKIASEKLFCAPIEKSFAELNKSLASISAENQTALGPAIVCALEMLKGSCPGSSIYIFTDGESNVGLGDLDTNKETAKDQYLKWAKEAREMAVTINFYAITTATLDPAVYHPIAKLTDGRIRVVAPDQMIMEVDFPKAQLELARNAEVMVILPKLLRFWGLLEKDTMKAPGVFVKKYGHLVGNSKELLQFVVDPSVLPKEEARNIKKLPVQLVIKWTGKDNKSYLQVLTKEFNTIRKKSTVANLEALKEFMHSNVMQKLANNEPDNAKAELGDLISTFMSSPEDIATKELKAMAYSVLDMLEEEKESSKKPRTEPFHSKKPLGPAAKKQEIVKTVTELFGKKQSSQQYVNSQY
eukprot:TRINITY_DN953_c0_g2_i1.p1 TRINITY_DN953_c0_g2~~TRINITY_DN953_c0_g2_i1.p1  ORF type:complete len:589 (-),score=61.16 TRINITY_DN953_c0_g2_i1:2621-4387(-)